MKIGLGLLIKEWVPFSVGNRRDTGYWCNCSKELLCSVNEQGWGWGRTESTMHALDPPRMPAKPPRPPPAPLTLLNSAFKSQPPLVTLKLSLTSQLDQTLLEIPFDEFWFYI